ncbi:MAG: TolC family protein [Ferruginibacter sp.]
MKNFFLILSLLPALFVKAQQPLQLPEAINTALKNSLDVQLAQNRVSVDSLFNNYGYAGGLPTVTATLNDNEQITSVYQKLNSGDVITRDNVAANTLSTNVTGSILLYNGGRIVATKKRLAQLQQQSMKLLNSQVQNIIADVSNAYYDVVRQQSYIKTIERSIDAAKQRLDIVKASQQVGLANNADLFQSQIDLNSLLQQQQAQQLVIDQAKAELLRLLTLKADSAVVISDSIIVDRSIDFSSILTRLEKNPDIMAAQDQVFINEQIVKETAALRYPSIRANTGYSFSRNNSGAGQVVINQNYGPTIGVSVGVPIYSGSSFKRQQKAAGIDVNTAGVQRDVLLRDYTAQAVKSYQAYKSTLLQLNTEENTYKLSSQLLDLVLQRFQLRQATIVEVKNAQQSFEESGYRLTNLRYAAKFAETELKRLASMLAN